MYTFGNGAVLDEGSSDGGAFNDPQANEVVIKKAYGGKKRKKNDNKAEGSEIVNFYTSVTLLEYQTRHFLVRYFSSIR
jgi:hypothetical protein